MKKRKRLTVLFGVVFVFMSGCQGMASRDASGGSDPSATDSSGNSNGDPSPSGAGGSGERGGGDPAVGGTEIGNPELLKIPASQVLFDNADSTLGASNAQDAFQELSLKLSEVMVGTWTIVNRNQEEYHTATGTVTIGADGTFNLSSGSFAAIGMGTDGSLCDHSDSGQVYDLIANGVVMFTHMNGAVQNTVIPTLASLKQDEIVFVGSGGCGSVGRQRVSVLSRE